MPNPYELFFGEPSFDFEKEKQKLVDDLNHLKTLSVEEYTFLNKWREMRSYHGDGFLDRSAKYKSMIWRPTNLEDETLTISEIEKIDPWIVYCPPDDPTWNTMRICCHTAEFNQSPGRFLKFLITDGKETRMNSRPRYLGLVAVASDVITITDRDNYIGWTNENKLNNRMLKHSAIGQTIVPTQPFGYNFLGGKLCAALITSDVVRRHWEEAPDGKASSCKLVGMTTTSLYGPFSMYNSMKWWKPCGSSRGKILMKPDDRIYKKWHDWIKIHKKEEYERQMTQKEGVSGPVTGAKLRVLSMIFHSTELRAKDFVHGFQRGVYYSMFYENGKEFLQNKIREDELKMKSLFQKDVSAIVDWWKPKAIERYKKLKKEGRLNSKILYYRDMVEMDYEEAKKTFFSNKIS